METYRDLEAVGTTQGVHDQVHTFGRLVGGLYGCWLKWDGEVWLDTCPVVLAHVRAGQSAGFTGTWICSICGEELSSCEHHGLETYEVEVSRSEGVCSACRITACDHMPGQLVAVDQVAILVEGEIHEVSVTNSPREPHARFTEIELRPQPPPLGRERARLRCSRCTEQCGGESYSEMFRGVDVSQREQPPAR